MLRVRSACFQTTIVAQFGRAGACAGCTILERIPATGGRDLERKPGGVALCEPANLALSGRKGLPWQAHGHPFPPTWTEPMHKIRALAVGLFLAGAVAACTDGALVTAPAAPLLDSGGTYGSGGRSAEDGGTATTSSTCEVERSGGTYGSGAKTETCPTAPTP
jgi:hypothetical protein